MLQNQQENQSESFGFLTNQIEEEENNMIICEEEKGECLENKEFLKQLEIMIKKCPVNEKKEIQRMGQLLTMDLDLQSPRMKEAMEELSLDENDLGIQKTAEWPTKSLQGFEYSFDQIKKQIQNACNARKALIKKRNSIKNEEREEKKQEVEGMTIDRYGHWRSRSFNNINNINGLDQSNLNDRTYIFDTSIYTKNTSLHLLNITQRFRSNKNMKALQNSKMNDLIKEINLSQSMSKLNARTLQYHNNKDSLLKEKQRQNRAYEQIMFEQNTDNKRVLAEQFRTKQRKLKEDILKRDEIQQGNMENKFQLEQQQLLEKNFQDLEKQKQILILKENQNDEEKQRGIKILLNQEEREKVIKQGVQKQQTQLEKAIKCKNRIQVQKMNKNYQVMKVVQQQVLGKQLRQSQSTQKHLTEQQQLLQKSITERQDIHQSKHNQVHDKINRHKEDLQDWKEQIVKVIDRKFDIKEQIIRKKEENLFNKKQTKELITQKVVNKNLEMQLESLQSKIMYDTTSRNSLNLDLKCRKTQQNMVTHSLKQKISQNIKIEKIANGIQEMIRKGKYDKQSINKLVDRLNVSESIQDQIKSMFEVKQEVKPKV